MAVAGLPGDCSVWLTSKGAINRAGARFAVDAVDYRAARAVQCYRLFRLQALDRVLETVVDRFLGLRVLVAARLKRLPSIRRKLLRDPSRPIELAAMLDIIGIRVICGSCDDVDAASTLIENAGYVSKRNDYRDSPSDSSYRAVHHYLKCPQEIGPSGERLVFHVEVQLRTFYQHLWALQSESYGEQVKEGGGPADIRSYLSELSEVIKEWEDNHPSENQAPKYLKPVSGDIAITLIKPTMSESDPFTLEFKGDYQKAAVQLVNWEDSLADGHEGALMVISQGGREVYAITHGTCIGLREVPLESWMPRPPSRRKEAE